MCLWFNYLSAVDVLVYLKGHRYFKMWFIIYITSLVAFKTALSSSPKQRSINDESPAKEFQGMYAQYARNHFKIANCVLMTTKKYIKTPLMVSNKSNNSLQASNFYQVEARFGRIRLQMTNDNRDLEFENKTNISYK